MRTAALSFFLLLGLALFCSSTNGAIDLGYPDRCFFSVGKSSSGAWWFIDPKGAKFFSHGVDVVTYSGDSPAGGTSAYNAAVKAKFGSQSAWADSVVSRLNSWKLNTLGAWSDTVVITKGLPYTRALSLGKGFDTWLGGLFPDVFNPAWAASVMTEAQAGCSPYRNDTKLIGYFLDNEKVLNETLVYAAQMWWGPIGDRGQDDWRRPGTILDQMLISLSTTAPGRVRAVSFLKSKYPTIQALNTAWGTTYASYDAITTIPAASTAHTTDSNNFGYLAAAQFFNVTRTAIRTYDPYHMLLGVRFVGAPTEGVLRAAGEYNDVVSINSYPSTSEPSGPPTSRITTIYNAAKKPILIGEFAYKAADSGLPNTKGAGLLVATQALRAEGYKNYTTKLAPLPGLVGFHWFQWSDQPAEGRGSDGENSNFGLVNKNDATYTALTNQMTTTGPQLWTLHESSTSGLSGAKCYTSLTCPKSCSGHGCCNTKTGECKCDTGFHGSDCSTDATKFSVTSFGSALDTNMWSTSTSASGSQANQAARVSTSSNQLKLSIAPCTTAAPCNGFNFTAGSVYTKSALWGFGVYTARFKAPSVTGFTAQFELNNRASPTNAITFRVRANQDGSNGGALDYTINGKYKYLKWVGALAIGNPSSAFHEYTIRYMPTYFSFYVDGTLLATYNATTSGNGLPTTTMSASLYISATNTSPKVSDAFLVSSVTYQQIWGATATC
ncbi:EGFlike domain containing protein [Acanthamoeba castellanii str. Neff]|uniref:EGFlike domain containing protein n=1 Tax=Acanthamoeba castellanii (strain ATCC 30010 / Neff) TaxID=1257118 RepID=L8H1I0_ACACF|nr:EGFlike domain containing protein [Acanthamoeba castellanii str. Neff]ELR18241.1 EGFlike domain containing protein [Acanthamoeba castellanii str. Neff]